MINPFEYMCCIYDEEDTYYEDNEGGDYPVMYMLDVE
jgi:hypothetical protein